MSEQFPQTQIVFLVDVNQEYIVKNKQNLQNFVNTLCLSAFRLLSYFDSVTSCPSIKSKAKHKQKSNLKWGFKFYNSQYHHSRIKQYTLRDFKLRYFEEFENEIEQKFEKQDDKNEKKQLASDCLRKTLIELLHDFQWQTPDITSPVKRIRGAKAPLVLEHVDSNRNLVFLFSVCPNNSIKLRQFSGKRVMDAEVFLESFMPQSLRKEFLMYRLQLFWVDLFSKSLLTSTAEAESKSIKLTECALEQLGGKLIQIESLVQLHHLPTANTASVEISHVTEHCQQRGQREDGFSKTTSLGLNLQQNTCDKVGTSNSKRNDQQQILRSILPFSSAIENLISRKCLFGSTFSPSQVPLNNCEHAVIDLQNGKKISLQLQKPLKQCSVESISCGNSVIQVPLGESSSTYPDQCLEEDSISILESANTLTSLCSENGVVHFCLCGVLPDDLSLNSRFGTEDVFVCTSDASATSVSDFHKLLLQMTAKKHSLVLQVKGNPCLFLMKPLTFVSATISSLTLGKTLTIEKFLQQQHKGSHFVESSESRAPSSSVASSNARESWRGILSKLRKEKIQVSSKTRNDVKKKNSGVCFDPKTVDKAYLPGCQTSLVSLVDKLNERISQLDFLTEGEVKTLRQLQQTYRYEVHPPRPWDKANLKTQHQPKSAALTEHLPETDTEKLTRQDSKKGRGSVASRGEMMVTRSRQTVKDVVSESDNKPVTDTKQATKPDVSSINIDFQDESELEMYLKDLYEKTLDSDGGLVLCAQTVIMVSLHYMKEKGRENPEESCDKFLRPEIIVPATSLRDKYQAADDTTKLQKIREYELQIILRLECQSIQLGGDTSLSESDGKIDEVVTMLRTLSFITEPATLSTFMKDTLVEHYIHTIPHTLGSIYDELMQPLPQALESILSPDHSADQSVLSQSLLSCESTGPPSNPPDISASQPASNKSDVLLNRSKHNTRKRSLVHHPSLAEVGQKRQIFVNVDTKAAKRKRKSSSHRKSTHSQPKKKQKVKGSAEKVCRNLFESDKKLERRQSVAVMEGVGHKSNHRRKALDSLKSPRRLRSPLKSPSFHLKKVSETPAHKQKSQNVLSRIEKERCRSQNVTNVHIVEESPVKSAADKYSPVQKKRAMALLRRSFYSAGPSKRSRNLTKSFQLADRIAGRPSFSSRLSFGSSLHDTSNEFKSPDKKNSSFMFSQLMGSPTPPKGTPRKTAVTPAKFIMDSPSMNTRSQSPACFDGTPKKTVVDTVLASPSMNTRSKSPGITVGFQKALFRESPSMKVNPISLYSSAGSGKKLSVTKQIESPSQNTRSKVTSTPTNAHRSVRAKMFLFRSPEHNNSEYTARRKESISKSKCVNLSNFEDRPKQSVRSEKEGNLKDGNASVVNLSWIEKDGKVGELKIIDSEKTSQLQVSDQLSRTPPPNRPTHLQCLQETKTPEMEKTPSPKQKISVVKTPNSLDHWPRKKKASADSPAVKEFSSSLSRQRKSKLEFKSPDSKLSESIEDEEVSFKIKNKEQLKSMMEEQPYLSPKPRRQGRSPSMRLVQQEDMGVGSKELVQTESLSSSSTVSVSSPNVKKRNLNLSPENAMVSSPSKRRRVSHSQSISGQQNLPVSYCLHRRVLSQKMPSMTSSQNSLGFATDNLSSQDGCQILNSQTGMGSLSQTSVESMEYFSLSNDEVFLCEKSKQDQDMMRSDSPVLGAKSRFRSPVHSSVNENLSSDLETGVSNSDASNSGSPYIGKCMNDANSKLSPSGRKYSPNVSARSLMHLMNSPLMTGSKEDLSSPRIDQDSLNLRRHKIKGRSKRSLNLQN